ncbi:ankyrin repeat domain-containing protein 60-like [Acanthaster planci]|uniref:Ankyrin repeat domain-containing protein 60-like n=1 Tax=Acanthaster planci TaxID=133434 RepID=A0A8B7YVY0_ACAPL|nr:ankyrin repeat domain-containing protein 60-like [Acanthaster planci]XP_022097470.1 ankyrin repeat domain-containing protein 60-like [Acanthaster planci]
MGERSGGYGLSSHKGKYFDLKVKLFTSETFPVRDIYNEMKVRTLKAKMEFVTGIPSHLQRLTYLDGADMMDDSDIKHHDIVPGATINLDVWYTWKTLIQAAADGDIGRLLKLGVSKDSDYTTPSSQEMNERSKAAWLAERAFVALCITAHRGHVAIVQKLIDGGANVHDKTPNGRTALHITAAQGKNNAVEVLLNNGATIEDPDNDGKNPLVLAGLWGHKSCERQIFLFQWQQRAAKQKPLADDGQLMAHQMYDSKLKTWLTGEQAQLYYAQILPPGEYSGTGIAAPRRARRPSSAPSERTEASERDQKIMEGNKGTQVSLGTESLRALRSTETKKPGKGRYSRYCVILCKCRYD